MFYSMTHVFVGWIQVYYSMTHVAPRRASPVRAFLWPLHKEYVNQIESNRTKPKPVLAASRGKRPRPVRRSSRDSKSRNSNNGCEETGLHPSLALSMLNHLLMGGNGHAPTLAARDSIMSDDVASHALEVRGGDRGYSCVFHLLV